MVRWVILPQPHEVLVRLRFRRIPHLEENETTRYPGLETASKLNNTFTEKI